MGLFEVTFLPDGIKLQVEEGALVSDALHLAGIEISYPCGRAGTCGKCAVEVHPALPPGHADIRALSKDQLVRGLRLACTTMIGRDMNILVTPGLRVHEGRILVDGIPRTFSVEPCIIKTYMELTAPSPLDETDVVTRLKQRLGTGENPCPGFGIDLARDLPAALRESGDKVTVVRSGSRILMVESGDTTARKFGIAFDIGTTTVAGVIFDLANGVERAQASRLNAQVMLGEDAVSRVKYVLDYPDGSRIMADRVRSVVNEIILEAASRAGIDSQDIYEAVFVGNAVMFHLFLGFDPSGLAQMPFAPVTSATVNMRASEAGVAIHPKGNICFLANIGGFVGSDTVGVMLACDYLSDDAFRLAVDVGTNGEIALRTGDSFLVCSAAAGPAFEGATLRCGMRASKGAVEHAHFAVGDIAYDVVGGGEPIGICGSGIIDIIAVLLDAGLLDESGRLVSPGEIPELPEDLANRLVLLDNQPAFLIHRSSVPGIKDVMVTQRDIRQVQLAKGAIRAGIELILRQAGIKADDLKEVLLAGAFGNYISRMSAVRIGLLPDIPIGRIRSVGNAALTGAKMALLSCAARDDAERIRKRSVHVDLAGLPDFADTFADAMAFPAG